MRAGFLPAMSAVALVLAAGPGLRAQDSPVPPEVKAFAAQYVAAYNAKDPARLQSLYLPQSRACITPAVKAVYDEMASMEMHDRVPPGYLLSLMPVNQGNLSAFATDVYFLAKPERELHIDYQYPNTNDGGQLILWLVRQNGRWMSDFPCMTEHGIKSFRDNAAARERYRAIAAEIKDPLRSQLISMLRAHQTGEASTRYRQATGSDMKTAMLVVNALQAQVK
jgi:hypothetical protein